jgi:hypothetical protein
MIVAILRSPENVGETQRALKFEDAPTKSSAFELLATVKAVTEFQKPNVVLGD